MQRIKRAPERARLKVFSTRLKAVQETSDEGIFEAFPAVFGNVDSYGERVIEGAFADTLAEWDQRGDPIPVIFSHAWENPMAHLGQVLEAEERDKGLWVRGQIDLGSTEFGDKVWDLMKRRRVTQWSFAFDVLESKWSEDTFEDPWWGEMNVLDLLKLKLYEVGPCLVGVNQETELLATKAQTPRAARDAWMAASVRSHWPGWLQRMWAKAAIPSHSTDTDDGAWDGPANEANLSNDDGADVYRQAYAWVDPDGDPDLKSSYRFIHHFVSQDGSVGAASTRACSAGIAILNGGRGGTTIPEGDREGVWRHLARHLEDADLEAPELQSVTPENAAARKEDRSSVDQQRLGSLLQHATTIVDTVQAMLDSTDPKSQTGGVAAPSTAPRYREPSSSPRWTHSLAEQLASGALRGDFRGPDRRAALTGAGAGRPGEGREP